jgi:hypothetical protein
MASNGTSLSKPGQAIGSLALSEKLCTMLPKSKESPMRYLLFFDALAILFLGGFAKPSPQPSLDADFQKGITDLKKKAPRGHGKLQGTENPETTTGQTLFAQLFTSTPPGLS